MHFQDNSSVAIFIGGSSFIAKASIEQLQVNQSVDAIIVLSRSLPPNPLQSSRSLNEQYQGVGQDYCPDYDHQALQPKIYYVTCDYQSATLGKFFSKLDSQLKSSKSNISYVLMFNGLLHNEEIDPEKKLEDIDLKNIRQVFEVNTFLTLTVLQKLATICDHHWQTKIVSLSARVGSIGDNRLGGWYSYRASKAALNMLLKTAAIEFKRRAKGCKLIAFHPGTTDTPLSKPFQQNVSEGSLFTPEFVAQCLFEVIDDLPSDGELSYVDWQGKSIAW